MTPARRHTWPELCGFHPRQQEAWEAVRAGARYTLYGGAMGGGKSYWLRWSLVRLLHLLHRRHGLNGIRAMLACESYPALRDRQIVRIQAEFPAWLGTWHEGTREFRIRREFGGGVLCLRNLDDPSKYQSAEFPLIGIDELTRSPRMMFDMLSTRQRWPGLPQDECRFLAASNPGGIGHAWVHDLWIGRRYDGGEQPEDFVYVPARASDNPSLSAGYERSLDRLPPKLREAYRDGNWEIFAGQVFAEWDPALHVVEPFELPRQWPRFRSLDYGYSPGYSAVLWGAEDPLRGTLYIYREHYAQERTLAELAGDIVSMSPASERILYTVADPSIYAVNEQTATSNAEVLWRHGVQCERADNDRLSGWRMLHEYLRPFDAPDGDGGWKQTAKLKVFYSCANLIRTLPTLVYDERPAAAAGNREDVRKGGEDHLGDALRYLVMSRPSRATLERDPELDAAAAREERLRREFPRADPRHTRRAGW